MKVFILVFVLFAITTTTIGQECNTFGVFKNGSNNEWGLFDLNSASVQLPAVISTPISDVDNPGSCVDGENWRIYFLEVTEVQGNGEFSIVTLDFNNNTTEKHSTTDGGFLEYSEVDSKLYIVQGDGSDNYQIGEMDPTSGTVSNIITSSVPIGSVVGKSCLNRSAGDIYLVEENGVNYDLITIDVSNGAVSKQAISNLPANGEIWFVEHNNSHGKTGVVLTDATGWHMAELDPATGALSNVTGFTIGQNPPGNLSFMDDKYGVLYFTTYGSSGWLIGVNIITGTVTEQALSQEVYILENQNFDCGLISVSNHAINEEVKVFPIPFNNELRAEVKGDQITNVSIYDLKGRLLIEQGNSQGLVNVGQLNFPGVYVLELETESGAVHRREILKSGN